MGFNITDYLNTESKKEVHNNFVIKKINIDKLDIDQKDFYHIDEKEVENIMNTIQLVGMQQNLVVVEQDNGRYKIITGKKRYIAIKRLVAAGYTEYRDVVCKVTQADSIIDELVLIFTNSTQRDRSDYERMKEVKRIKELLTELQKTQKIEGRKAEIIAKLLGTSKSDVGRLENIDNHLIPEFKEEFKEEKLPTSTANTIASQDETTQQQLYDKYKEEGSIKNAEVKEAIEIAKVSIEKPVAAVDKESLIINGRINPNKNYNGLTAKEVTQFLAECNQLDVKFWQQWPTITQKEKRELIKAYGGICGRYKEYEYVFREDSITFEKQGQGTAIQYVDIIELIDAMITTGLIITYIQNSQPQEAKLLVALKVILEHREELMPQEQCVIFRIAHRLEVENEI